MKILLSVLIMFSCHVNYAQSYVDSSYTIESEIYNEDRSFDVYLPESYLANVNTNYAVAYLFDGQFSPYFGMVCSIMDYYSQTNEGVPMIVVSVKTKDRWDEFVSVQNKEGKLQGEGRFVAYLKEELIPVIETRYRTSEYRLGIGHSLGGTFLFSQLFRDSSLFDGIIAVSPNLSQMDNLLVRECSEYVSRYKDDVKYVYTSAGDIGSMEEMFKYSLAILDSNVRMTNSAFIDWNVAYLNGENHMSTFPRTFNDAYLDFSKKWNMSDQAIGQAWHEDSLVFVQNLRAMVKNNSEFRRDTFNLDYLKVREIGKRYLALENYKAAIVMMDISVLLKKGESQDDAEYNKYRKKIKRVKAFYHFLDLSQSASIADENGNLKEACQFYDEAFKIEDKRGTYKQRMIAVPVYARNGEIDKAFEQLELLANYFELRGADAFVDDPNLEVLKTDKRWGKLINKLEENAKNN